MNQKSLKSIGENVINKIKSGEIKMKPRIYFILRTVFWVSGVLLSFLFIIYLISFIVFSLRASGVWFLPRFGLPAAGIFLKSLPWLLIVLALISIAALEIFTKHFTFVYRRPILYSLLGIILIVLAVGLFVGRTSFHPNLFWNMRDRPFSGVAPFYRDYGAPRFNNIHYGVVSEITENGFKIDTARGENIEIIIKSKNPLQQLSDIEVGDTIIAIGDRSDHVVNAFDVREIEKDFDIFPAPRFFDRHFLPPVK